MYGNVKKRVLQCARYIADTGATVRDAAKQFGIGKSTVHKDMTDKLPQIDTALAQKVSAVLQTNKDERHIRGGLATQKKYKAMK